MIRRTWTAADERASRQVEAAASDLAHASTALACIIDDDEARKRALAFAGEAQERLSDVIATLEAARAGRAA